METETCVPLVISLPVTSKTSCLPPLCPADVLLRMPTSLPDRPELPQ